MPAITVAEYLSRVADPDCDYLEGRLVERNVGELGHSDIQTSVAFQVRGNRVAFWAGVEARFQVKRERFRVPDVVVTRGAKRPAGRILTQPPEVAVEVLSPDDRTADLQDKLDDYFAFGIPCVWVLDPERERAWIYTPAGSREVKDELRNEAGDLRVPLSAIFSTPEAG